MSARPEREPQRWQQQLNDLHQRGYFNPDVDWHALQTRSAVEAGFYKTETTPQETIDQLVSRETVQSPNDRAISPFEAMMRLSFLPFNLGIAYLDACSKMLTPKPLKKY